MPTLTAVDTVQDNTDLAANPVFPRDALELVGMRERSTHFPAQLSGGEQQRIAIARALAKRPELILADEPTGALDVTMARRVLGLLQRLNREQGITVILITHNPAISEIAERTIRLVSGAVAEEHVNENPLPAEEVEW